MKRIVSVSMGYALVSVAACYFLFLNGSIRRAEDLVQLAVYARTMIPIGLVYYFVGLYFMTYTTVNYSMRYNPLDSFKFAVGIVLGFSLPWAMCEVLPVRPIDSRSLVQITAFLLTITVASCLTGSLLGLLGMIMTNQLFGNRIKKVASRLKAPNQAL